MPPALPVLSLDTFPIYSDTWRLDLAVQEHWSLSVDLHISAALHQGKALAQRETGLSNRALL
jgi:hypothetical protein